MAVHELDDHLVQWDDLDVMWGFDLDAFLREHTHSKSLSLAMPAAGQPRRSFG